MKPASNDASACHRNGNRHDRPRRPDITEVERQMAGLANRSTQDLRVAWRKLHDTGPPLGLSRDLLIRALANQLQERSYGGVSAALQRRLRSLARASENGTTAVDPGLTLPCSDPACRCDRDTRRREGALHLKDCQLHTDLLNHTSLTPRIFHL